MKRFGFMVFIVLMVLFITCSVDAQREIEFTDSDGVFHSYGLATDESVVIVKRSDDGSSPELIAAYTNGELSGLAKYRADRSSEVFVNYEDGVLASVNSYGTSWISESIFAEGMLDYVGVGRASKIGDPYEAALSTRDGQAVCLR